jgi:hypothetical protein
VVTIVFMCALGLPLALGICTLAIMSSQETNALFSDKVTPVKWKE